MQVATRKPIAMTRDPSVSSINDYYSEGTNSKLGSSKSEHDDKPEVEELHLPVIEQQNSPKKAFKFNNILDKVRDRLQNKGDTTVTEQ